MDKDASPLSKIKIPNWISENVLKIIVAVAIAVILAILGLK